MKKILFLLLSMAVATSAFAIGQRHMQAPKYQSNKKVEKVTTAPVLSYIKSTQTMDNAPKFTPQHRNVLPGLRVLERSTRPASFNAPIVDQPDGTVSYYRRSGKATYNSLNETGDDIVAAYGDQSGIVTVVTNGNYVYFKNLLYDPEGFYPDYWVRGTKNNAGTQITITLPHDIDATSYASYGVTIQLYWGSTRVQNGEITWTRNNTTSAYFDIASDGTLSLRNGNSSTTFTGNGLCAAYRYNTQYYYDLATIYNTTLTPLGDIPEAPVMYTDDDIDAMDGDFVTYYRTGYYWYRTQNEEGETVLDMDEQKGYGYIFYDADGETVYFRNPVYGWNNGIWMKGTIEGNTLHFPLGQYIYWDEYFMGLKTTWGMMELAEDNGLSFTEFTDVDEVTFTIDGNVISMDNCGLNEDMTQFVGLSLMLDSAYMDPGWFGPLDFWTDLYSIPATPTNVNVTPGSTTANVTWTDDVNAMWNIRYRVIEEGGDMESYLNEFETDEELAVLTGWDMDGDDYWWEPRALDDGTYCITSASYVNNVGAVTPDNWLVVPGITLNGVVSVDAWGQDASWAAEVFKVYIYPGDIENVEDPTTDFIAISGDITTTGTITTYTFNIPEEYQGQVGAVAIRHYNVTDMFMLNIDNLYVGDPDNVPQWTTVYGFEELEALLEGLTPETNYELQVQGVNPGGVGEWSEAVQFTTLADQPQPVVVRGDATGEGDVNMDDLSALINFLLGGSPDAINYDNAAICDFTTGDESEVVSMDDLSALINFLLNGNWPN